MSEISFASEAEALAYADANGIATEWKANAQDAEGKSYSYTESNIERRGTGCTIRDDTRKADGSRGTPTALTGLGQSTTVIPNAPTSDLTPIERQIRDNLARDPHFYDAPAHPAATTDTSGA